MSMEDRIECNVLLSIINKCVRLVRNRHGVDIDIYSLPLDDEKVYGLINTDTSTDVFGLESHGMHGCIYMLKPAEFRHLAALQAMWRPCLVQKFTEYQRNKENPEEIKFHSDLEEDILKESYGVVLYCEQVIEMIHRYSGIPVDVSKIIARYIRKSMKAELDVWKSVFIIGTGRSGYTKPQAEVIWDRIISEGESTIYRVRATYDAMLTYQCFWLKTYYPDEYRDALVPLVNSEDSW